MKILTKFKMCEENLKVCQQKYLFLVKKTIYLDIINRGDINKLYFVLQNLKL